MIILPTLPYDYAALEPVIDEATMKIHHLKHHQAYLDKLNAVLDKYPDWAARPVEELLKNLATVPAGIKDAVNNHGGGHMNHSLFWQWMSPDGGGEPSGELAEKIAERYGSFQGFVDEFTAKSLGVFGSGWAWLQPDMEIITTPNQDTPIMQGMPEPILGLDVWEHAYYLDYKNKRPDYIAAWWNVVNWDVADQRFKKQ